MPKVEINQSDEAVNAWAREWGVGTQYRYDDGRFSKVTWHEPNPANDSAHLKALCWLRVCRRYQEALILAPTMEVLYLVKGD